MSKQVNYNENLCAGAAIRDDKGRRISKLFEASHPKMTVGYAKNLIMPNDPTEQEFSFRQSGGGVIEDGVAVVDKVKGNSVVWNQMCPNSIASWEGKTGLTEDGEIIRQTIPANQWGNAYPVRISSKCLIVATARVASETRSAMIFTSKDSVRFTSQSWETKNLIASDASGLTLQSGEGTGDELIIEWKNIYIHDLTQMFGAGNEPTTYEEFLSRKPKVADEYAYNEGTIVNNKVEAVVTTGRNLWDEEWELGAIASSTGANTPSDKDIRSKNYIPVTPGTTYYCKCPQSSLNVRYYDANKNFLAAFNTTIVNAFTIPSGAHYLRFWGVGTTYNHDICINLFDPAFNGQYTPYEKHELDLSWVKDIKDAEGVKLFEDGMKSAGTAFDEVAKGKAIKRIGAKVFDGTEEWRTIGSVIGFNIGIPNALRYNVLVVGYTYHGSTWELEDMEYSINDYFVGFKNDKYADIESWKAHLAELYAAGTPLVVYYELAEPIEVEYDEKNLTYPVVAGGTEEAIASEPSTAFRADIGYGIDAVKTILDLRARVKALEGK